MSTMIRSPRLANSRCVVANVGRDGGGSRPSLRRDDDDADVAIAKEECHTTP
jgi:hypothetical protein